MRGRSGEGRQTRRLGRWLRNPVRGLRPLPSAAQNRRRPCFSPEIVERRSRGGDSNLRPEQSSSTATGNRRRPAERIVRFARPNILIYDGHVIDLYRLICALYPVACRNKAIKRRYPNLLGPPPKFRTDQSRPLNQNVCSDVQCLKALILLSRRTRTRIR